MSDNVTNAFEIIEKMTVLELNELRKKIETEFDVQATVAAAPGAAAGDDAGAAAASTVSVYVKDPGSSKIEVIKAIREITGLGLKEAKEMAESAGATPLKADIDQAEADHR